MAKRLGIVEPLPKPKELGTDGKGRKVTTKKAVRLDFDLNGYTFSDEFMIVPKLSDPVIISELRHCRRGE